MGLAHSSPFAGTWYPESPAELGALLADCFAESRRRTGPYLTPGGLAYVVPHAAPAYSGTVAAAVYRALESNPPEQIVMLGFPHRGGLSGVAAPDVGAICTPLGRVALDLDDYPRLPERELCDHSSEIQLPFLQTVAPRARVTPLYTGRMTADERSAKAAEIASRWHPGVVYLASTDFTHYGRSFHFVPFPPDEARLRALDFECIDAAGSLDSGLFLETLASNGATVCGSAPVALLLDILRALGSGRMYQETLDYRTSGEITGERDQSVSYAALGYYPRESFEISGGDGAALVRAAEATLATLRESGRREPVPARGSKALEARRGAFVTLRSGEQLLGCIGHTQGRGPLSEEIPELTLSAALEDERFRPAAGFSGDIQVEVSILTPFRRIRGEQDLEIGRHGAMLEWKDRTGLLLPQVAEDHGLTKARDFLSALARKTMLPRDAWRLPDARVFTFEAQRFSTPGLRGRS